MTHIPASALVIVSLSIFSGCVARSPPPSAAVEHAEQAVRRTELAFAKTMADRDFDAFVSHVSAEAVFFDGTKVEHGTAEVSAAWKPLFRGPKAPFSWMPDHVEGASVRQNWRSAPPCAW